MIVFLKLLLAHFLGDFLFQPDKWVIDKEQKKWRSAKFYLHILVHFVLSLIIVFDFAYLLPIVLICISHFLIDLGKLSWQNNKNQRIIFLADQVLHLVAIAFILELFQPFLNGMFGNISPAQALITILALLMISAVSSRVIKILISRWTPEKGDSEEDSLSDAGKWIGILERLFIFAAVISQSIEAVGFLLAAKSVFRFGDLKEAQDRKLTEYILIGTLISFGIAVLIGFLYLELNKLLLIE